MFKVKALLNIDYTVDFVVGALPCGDPAIQIEEEIVRITKEFADNGDYVVFPIDLHFENDKYHPETELYPPHNIVGTKGREFYGKLKSLYEEIKHYSNVYYMDKTRYSAFSGTDLEIKLHERGIKEVHVVGVATDICLLHTIVDLYSKGFHIVVHERATASFNQDGHKWAIEHFKNALNAEIV